MYKVIKFLVKGKVEMLSMVYYSYNYYVLQINRQSLNSRTIMIKLNFNQLLKALPQTNFPNITETLIMISDFI